MDNPKAVLSMTEFLQLLQDQALLYHARQQYNSKNGEWPDEVGHLKAIRDDASWLFAVVPPFIDVLFEECRQYPGTFLPVHTAAMQSIDMMNRKLRVQSRAGTIGSLLIERGCYCAVQALCFSPRFLETFDVMHLGKRFRIHKDVSNVNIECVPRGA